MKSPKHCESVSLKGIVTDNDSGYISQNIESNSSYDTSMDHRQSIVASELDIKEAFLSENALLEKPQLTLKSDSIDTEDCGEFDHLYFMSTISDNAIVPSSVTSQSTTFSGFDEVLNISETITTAPSIVLTESTTESPIRMKTFVLHPDKENDGNFENIKNNSKVESNECKLNSSFDDTDATSNSIQNRLMSANNDMSSFESFYSFVCKLYTKNEPVSESPAISSINPSQLHLNQKQNESDNTNSPHKNLYLELENVKKVPEVVNANSSTPTKQTLPIPSVSPELFSDDEGSESVVPNNSLLQKSMEQAVSGDYILTKRTRDSLGGVPPPPSITLPLISASEILDKVKENKALFTTQEDINNIKQKVERQKCLLLDSGIPDFKCNDWPDVLQIRFHGIHYNRSKISEEFEHLCVKYIERYIGAETQSSCTSFGIGTSSPTKRRFKYGRTSKSPGKNLSHLARRRITFSRDSLVSAGISANCTLVGSRTRQIMVDAKKFDMLPRRKSPKKKSPRKTPRKSPKKKANTPKSSGKKKHMVSISGRAIEENLNQLSFLSARPSTTKRALFQSPPHRECNSSLSWFNSDNSNSSCSQHSIKSSRRALFPSPKRNSPSKMTISNLYPARRKMTPKRALFKSPDKQSILLQEVSDRKRKRMEDDEKPSNKLAKCTTETKDLLNESKPSTSLGSSQDISQHRKKKLMWTVAEALRTQNIDLKHPQFKVYASVLARVIRHFLPNLFTNSLRTEGSTTESMLRIARQHAFAVTRGKTVDQIIREAQKRSRIRRSSSCAEYDKFGESSSATQLRNKENILQDRINIMEENLNNKPQNKPRRSEKVERIRRVINFGEDNDVSNTSIR